VLCSPRIPYTDTLRENIQMLLVGHSAHLACKMLCMSTNVCHQGTTHPPTYTDTEIGV
jgi:hypothetical protein